VPAVSHTPPPPPPMNTPILNVFLPAFMHFRHADIKPHPFGVILDQLFKSPTLRVRVRGRGQPKCCKKLNAMGHGVGTAHLWICGSDLPPLYPRFKSSPTLSSNRTGSHIAITGLQMPELRPDRELSSFAHKHYIRSVQCKWKTMSFMANAREKAGANVFNVAQPGPQPQFPCHVHGKHHTPACVGQCPGYGTAPPPPPGYVNSSGVWPSGFVPTPAGYGVAPAGYGVAPSSYGGVPPSYGGVPSPYYPGSGGASPYGYSSNAYSKHRTY